MLHGFAADSPATRSRADRAVAAGGRLSAGLAAACGVLSPIHRHLVGQPLSAPHTLGAAWGLAGVAAWCSGAQRRSAALAFAGLGLAVGLWAGLSGAASPLDAVAVCFAAGAVLMHDRNVNAPPSELLGHGAVLLIALAITALGATATGVPIDLGWAGRIGGFTRIALATGLVGVAIAATAWLDTRRAAPGGPRWFAALAGAFAGAISLVLWWALRSREAGFAAASGGATTSYLPVAVLGMGLALAGLLAAPARRGRCCDPPAPRAAGGWSAARPPIGRGRAARVRRPPRAGRRAPAPSRARRPAGAMSWRCRMPRRRPPRAIAAPTTGRARSRPRTRRQARRTTADRRARRAGCRARRSRQWTRRRDRWRSRSG